jgi:DNA-binding beta-propeller fold protein YncE
MQFKFIDGNYHSGWMAFTGPATSRLLLLTDTGHDAVHVIDVAGRVHAGYVAAPGTIAGPRGVAARGSLVAISVWKSFWQGDHVVRVFEGSGAMWTAVRVVGGGFGGPGSADGQLDRPRGLRFTGDGTGLAVADWGNGRVSVFRVEDGSFARHVATGLGFPRDVEEVEGGWLVACGNSNTIEFVGGGRRSRMGKRGRGDGEFECPTALALVPGVGPIVREGNGRRVQVFATTDAVLMASMSACRVGWIIAVARGVAHRWTGVWPPPSA